jgi:hypothetical protein
LLGLAGQELLKQGVLSVFILALAYAWWAKDQALLKSLEARIVERETLTKAIMESAVAMREMATAQKEAADTHREVAATLKRDLADAVIVAMATKGQR